LAPARWGHAYEAGSDVTLCGLPIFRLYWREFPQRAFAGLNPRLRCAQCNDLAGAPSRPEVPEE